MPQTPTPNLALRRPNSAGDEFYNVQTDLNDNWDKIDAAVGAQPVTSSTRPASAYNGKLIRETDTGRVYVSNGTSPGSASFTTQLMTVGVRMLSASATRAVLVGRAGDTDDRWYANDTGGLFWGSGSATPDTNLYRNAANELKTDDNLVVAGNLTVLGIGERAVVTKSADTTRPSTTTVTADPHLTYPLAANAKYRVQVRLSVIGNGGDIKVNWTVPSGAAGIRFVTGPEVGVTDRLNTNARLSTEVLSNAPAYGTVATSPVAVFEDAVVTTSASAGSVTVLWAQNTSNANGTTVEQHSFMTIERLA